MSDDRIWFRPDEALKSKIDWFESQRGCEDTSDAVTQLIEIGYRESCHPLGSRVRDRCVDLASQFALFGVLALVLAFTHPAAGSDVVVLGMALVMVAVVFLSVAGIVRAVAGQGEAGVQLHSRVQALLEVAR